VKPYKTYVVGSNLYTYGDGHTHRTTLEMDDIVASCATIDHICLLDSHGVAMYGNINKEGCVEFLGETKDFLNGPFTMMAAMPNRMFMLSMGGSIYEILPKSLKLVDCGRYKQITCGANFMIALDADGFAYRYGKWFDGSYVESLSPFWTNTVDVACGDYHCILLQEDGQAICHGEDEYKFDPVPNVVKIYAAGKSSLLTGINFNKYFGRAK